MIRKFECWTCNQIFQADDRDWVECPHCHSDNVEYASYHLPRWVKWIPLLLLTLGSVGYGIYCAIANYEPKLEMREYGNEAGEVLAQKADSAYLEAGGTIEPSLSIATIEYNEDGDTYKCRFQVDYPPSQPWKIVIVSRVDKSKVIAESEDGIFDNLPYAEYKNYPELNGFYIVRLLDKLTNEPLIDDKEFPNFEKQIKIKTPWTTSILESKLNGAENLTDNDYLAEKHKVIVTNKPANDTSPTSTLREVQDLLRMCNITAKVLSVEYDDMKKISVAKLKINYPTGWMQDEEDE